MGSATSCSTSRAATSPTRSDPEGRPTVMDLVKGVKDMLYPVGRLDYDSEGCCSSRTMATGGTADPPEPRSREGLRSAGEGGVRRQTLESARPRRPDRRAADCARRIRASEPAWERRADHRGDLDPRRPAAAGPKDVRRRRPSRRPPEALASACRRSEEADRSLARAHSAEGRQPATRAAAATPLSPSVTPSTRLRRMRQRSQRSSQRHKDHKSQRSQRH